MIGAKLLAPWLTPDFLQGIESEVGENEDEGQWHQPHFFDVPGPWF
jgi:hypothetical protein